MRKDYYAVLGLPRESSLTDIRMAYRTLAARYHPDKFSASAADEQAATYHLMVELNEAMSILGNVEKRSTYDRELRAAAAVARASPRKTGTAAEPPAKQRAEPVEPPRLAPVDKKPALDTRVRALRTRLQDIPLRWKDVRIAPWAWSIEGHDGGRPLLIAYRHLDSLDAKDIPSIDKAIDRILAEQKALFRSPWIVTLLSGKLLPEANSFLLGLDALTKRRRGWLKKRPLVMLYDERSNRVLKFGEMPAHDQIERILKVLLHP